MDTQGGTHFCSTLSERKSLYTIHVRCIDVRVFSVIHTRKHGARLFMCACINNPTQSYAFIAFIMLISNRLLRLTTNQQNLVRGTKTSILTLVTTHLHGMQGYVEVTKRMV